MTGTLNVILLSAGVVSGTAGVFIFTQPLLALTTVLVATPLIQRLADDMLADRWKEVIAIFLGIAGFITVSVWVISSITDVTGIMARFRWCLVVTGAGVIQLAWVFLVAERRVIAQVECGD